MSLAMPSIGRGYECYRVVNWMSAGTKSEPIFGRVNIKRIIMGGVRRVTW